MHINFLFTFFQLLDHGLDGILISILLFGMCLAASQVVEAAECANENINFLLARFEKLHRHMSNIIMKKKLILTAWKIFLMERSFILNIYGTILTYGILLATQQISKNIHSVDTTESFIIQSSCTRLFSNVSEDSNDSAKI